MANGFSPAELLMGRRIRTSLPTATSNLRPKIPEDKSVREREKERIIQQKRNYDKHHGTRQLRELVPGEEVWIVDKRTTGTVVRKDSSPRSYIIETAKGQLRRNRFQLSPLAISHMDDLQDVSTQQDAETASERGQQQPVEEVHEQQPELPPGSALTRSGRLSKPPKRLIEQ